MVVTNTCVYDTLVIYVLCIEVIHVRYVKGSTRVRNWHVNMNADEYKKLRLAFESTPRYFDREGKPMELLDWARLCEDHDYKIVKQEEVGKYFVSTIWVGLNMSFWKEALIKIFETMILLIDDDDKSDDPIKGYQDRYSTEAEALEGHAKAVQIAKGEISLEEEFGI